jgi:iron-sulfur cluster repair protein YtfE (RIC family)
MKDIEIFAGKTFSDILQEIHSATLHKRNRIDELILELRRLIHAPEDAVVVAPIIAEYLEIMVKNDEHLVKIAAIVQRIMAVDAKGKTGGSLEDLLSEHDKAQLMAEALDDLKEATEKLEPPQLPDTSTGSINAKDSI